MNIILLYFWHCVCRSTICSFIGCILRVPDTPGSVFHIDYDMSDLFTSIHFIKIYFCKNGVYFAYYTMTCCLVAKSCPTLLRPHGLAHQPALSSVSEISQARILEWVAISSSGESSQPKDQICLSCVSCICRWILYHCTTWEAPDTRLPEKPHYCPLWDTLNNFYCFSFPA